MITLFVFSACMIWLFIAIIFTGIQLLEWISAWRKRRVMLMAQIARWEAQRDSIISIDEFNRVCGMSWEPADKVNWRKEGF